MPTSLLPRAAAALLAAAAVAGGPAVLAGCGGGGAPGRVAGDVPAGGLAPGTAWYLRRTYTEPLGGDSPEAGRRWTAALPVRAETWAEPGGRRVTAHVEVIGPARFPTEGDRLAYLASGSDDAAIRPGTVLQDGLTSGGTAGLRVLGLAADVEALPDPPTAAAARGLVSFAAHQETVRPSPEQVLTGIADVLAVAPVPTAYRRALVAAARAVPGVRARSAAGGGLTLALGDARLEVDGRTGALRAATGLRPPLGRVEARAVVARVGARP